MDDSAWYQDLRMGLERAYLQTTDLMRQSGFRGDPRRWKRARSVIVHATDRNGAFLDVGCANGFLLESIVVWAARRGLVVEPFGLDISAALVSLARFRLPHLAAAIFVGNVMDWDPPRQFDFVRTELLYVPEHRRRDLVERLLSTFVSPGGRLIVCGYGSRSRQSPPLPVGDLLRGWGHPPVGEVEAKEERFVLARVAWVDA